MQAETFTGAGASGEARKWLMTPLEFKCAMKQMKFALGLYRMFKILGATWKTKGLLLDQDSITFSFDRNFPQELRLEAEILGLLDGHVSKKTALTLFSPVRDPEKEMKQIADEKNDTIDLDELDDEGIHKAAQEQ